MTILREKLINHLVLREGRVLRNFLISKFGDTHEADDIAQEAFLRFHQLSAAKTIENERAFLFKIASNIAIDRIREARQRKVRERNWVDAHSTELNGVTISNQPSPEAEFESMQKISTIMTAIKELPKKCQHVFILHKFKGLTYNEVAKETNLSKSMVGKYMMQALAHLEGRLR